MGDGLTYTESFSAPYAPGSQRKRWQLAPIGDHVSVPFRSPSSISRFHSVLRTHSAPRPKEKPRSMNVFS